MKTHASNRLFRVHALAAGIAAALAVPTIAAEPLFQVPLYGNADMTRYETNNVELGIGYPDISGSKYKFGEWNGLFREDPFAIANLNWLSRDTTSGRYWTVAGRTSAFRRAKSAQRSVRRVCGESAPLSSR